MKITVGRLREILHEVGKISAHPDYLAKEAIREQLQSLIVNDIADGKIQDQEALEDFFATADMAMKALRMVPFDAYTRIAYKRPTSG